MRSQVSLGAASAGAGERQRERTDAACHHAARGEAEDDGTLPDVLQGAQPPGLGHLVGGIGRTVVEAGLRAVETNTDARTRQTTTITRSPTTRIVRSRSKSTSQ